MCHTLLALLALWGFGGIWRNHLTRSIMPVNPETETGGCAEGASGAGGGGPLGDVRLVDLVLF